MYTQRSRSRVRVFFSFLAIVLFLGGCFNPVAPAPSGDANLASLAMTPDPFGELSFSAGTTSYTVNVPNSVESVAVTATSSDGQASVVITANDAEVGQGADILLAVGDTEVQIVVTAEDQTTKTYTLTITRAPSDPNDSSLASLVVGSEEVALAGPGDYPLSFDNAVEEVAITPTASDSQAVITVAVDEGAPQAADSGEAFGPVALAVGETLVEILVTAGDGTTTSEYSVTITRELPTYSVTFLPNGGAGSMDDQEIIEGETVALSAIGFTRLGHSFVGWDEDNNDEVDYADGENFTMGSADVTLRAIWTANDYTVVFDKNNSEATGTMTAQTITFGTTEALNELGYSLDGATFLGWAETSGGAPVYGDTAAFTMATEGATLYARWDTPHVLQELVISGEIAGLLDYSTGLVDETYDPSGSDAVAYDADGTELNRDLVESRAFSLAVKPIEDSLYPITEDVPDTLTIDDPEANIQLATLEIDNGELGLELLYGTYTVSVEGDVVTVSQTDAQYLYTDRPVTVTGSVTEEGVEITYDLSLIEGWNQVLFAIVSEVNTSTGEGSGTGAVTTEEMPGDAVWYAADSGFIVDDGGVSVSFSSINEPYDNDYWIRAVLVAVDTNPTNEENWLAATDFSLVSAGSAGPALFYDTGSLEPFFGDEDVAYELFAVIVDDPESVEVIVDVTSSDGGSLAIVNGGVSSAQEISLSDATYTERE